MPGLFITFTTMSLDVTPISSIAEAWTATVAMVTKALPSDEQKLEYFKLHYQLRYVKLRIKIEERIYSQIVKDNPKMLAYSTIVNYVNWDDANLPQSEQDSLVKVLCGRFGITVT